MVQNIQSELALPPHGDGFEPARNPTSNVLIDGYFLIEAHPEMSINQISKALNIICPSGGYRAIEIPISFRRSTVTRLLEDQARWEKLCVMLFSYIM